jgi:hypothetical protein
MAPFGLGRMGGGRLSRRRHSCPEGNDWRLGLRLGLILSVASFAWGITRSASR